MPLPESLLVTLAENEKELSDALDEARFYELAGDERLQESLGRAIELLEVMLGRLKQRPKADASVARFTVLRSLLGGMARLVAEDRVRRH